MVRGMGKLSWEWLVIVSAMGLAPAYADSLQSIAVDAYIYGYPLLLMKDMERKTLRESKFSINQFYHERNLPTPGDRGDLRPNDDTLYSVAWVDLSGGPMVLQVPDTEGRYYIMQMLDAWTHVFANPGARTTGTEAQSFVILGPDASIDPPAGVTALFSPTNLVRILGRTQVNGETDLESVHKIQDRYRLMPLNEWRQRARQSAAPSQEVPRFSALEFFQELSWVTREDPPHANDQPALQRFEEIGFVPQVDYAPSEQVKRAIQTAPTIALRAIARRAARLGRHVNGWRMILESIGEYGTRYLDRAAVAFEGIGANLVDDEVDPATSVDSFGRPLEGLHDYVLHFNPGQTPPVSAFWSLTLYGADGYLAVNDRHRYAIHGDDPLRLNADGSLDLYIQNVAPAAEKLSNWLPAPPGRFQLVLRLYSPREAVLNVDWAPPPVVEAR